MLVTSSTFERELTTLFARVNMIGFNEWILGLLFGIPADFAEADDIITNLAKEREPGIEIIERTPLSLIMSCVVLVILWHVLGYLFL